MKFIVVIALFAVAAAELRLSYHYDKKNYYNRVVPWKAESTHPYVEDAADEAARRGHILGKRYAGTAPISADEAAPAQHIKEKREADADPKAAPAAGRNAGGYGRGYGAPEADTAADPNSRYGYGYGYTPVAERADPRYGVKQMGGYKGKREAEDDNECLFCAEEVVGYHRNEKREAVAAPKAGYPYIATPEVAPYAATEYWGRKKRHAEAAAKAAAEAAPNSGGAKRAGYGYGYGYVYAPVEIRGYRTSVAERGVRPVAERAGRVGVAEKVGYHAIGKRETESGRGKRSDKAAPLVCIQGYASGWSVCTMGRPRAGLP